MDNIKVAKELVKIAKELTGGKKVREVATMIIMNKVSNVAVVGGLIELTMMDGTVATLKLKGVK